MKNFLITGGCGFIGSHFVVNCVKNGNFVVNLDKMTYAANLNNVKEVSNHQNYRFIQGDICSQSLIFDILNDFKIDAIVNFAAESHVDNSIIDADLFVKTNVNGTLSLLQASRQYLENTKKENFRFIHISTDEVFGSLSKGDKPFDENSPYKPNSPYSASKAASDHLVRAWFATYKLPIIITNCSNNFGENQHQEKLIPTIIRSALQNKNIPIYGNGKNIRDWIYVGDHCAGIELALNKGKVGESYCFGGEFEITNIEIAHKICEILDALKPRKDGISYKNQIKFVEDRKGHDYRYAISNDKAYKELGFKVSKNFAERLRQVVLSIASLQ
ncbi:MAG TPA: dTDP-glucose 4,6-dehydratase [Rickettsiales bacterium]|nr:dTDP-glucose 4,6-dehydratase [Rickettsiales bacterium]